MLLASLCALVALVTLLPAQGPDFSGRFVGPELTFESKRTAEGYAGHLLRNGTGHAFEARSEGTSLRGSFQVGDSRQPFSAVLHGVELRLKTGGRSYRLRRAATAPQHPLEGRRTDGELVCEVDEGRVAIGPVADRNFLDVQATGRK